jgi:hypothetical protein
MNKVNIGFNIYVYKDLSKFQIKQIFELIPFNSQEAISGYIWKSNANNEINVLNLHFSSTLLTFV